MNSKQAIWRSYRGATKWRKTLNIYCMWRNMTDAVFHKGLVFCCEWKWCHKIYAAALTVTIATQVFTMRDFWVCTEQQIREYLEFNTHEAICREYLNCSGRLILDQHAKCHKSSEPFIWSISHGVGLLLRTQGNAVLILVHFESTTCSILIDSEHRSVQHWVLVFLSIVAC